MLNDIVSYLAESVSGAYLPAEKAEKLLPLELHFVSDACRPGHTLHLVNKRGVKYDCKNAPNSNTHFIAHVEINMIQPQMSFHLEDYYNHSLSRKIPGSNLVRIPPGRTVAFCCCERTIDDGAELQFVSFVSYVCALRSHALVALRSLLFALQVRNGPIYEVSWLSTVCCCVGYDFVDQSPNLPVVIAALIGFAWSKAGGTGRVLDHADFPAVQMLRGLLQDDLVELRAHDQRLFEHAEAGVEELLRHHLTRSPAELVWLENIVGGNFVGLTTRLTLDLLVLHATSGRESTSFELDVQPEAFSNLVAGLSRASLESLAGLLYLVSPSQQVHTRDLCSHTLLLQNLLLDLPRHRAVELSRMFLDDLRLMFFKGSTYTSGQLLLYRFLPLLVQAMKHAQDSLGELSSAFAEAARTSLLQVMQCPHTEKNHLQAAVDVDVCCAFRVNGALLNTWLRELLAGTPRSSYAPIASRPLEMLLDSDLISAAGKSFGVPDELLIPMCRSWVQACTRPNHGAVRVAAIVDAVRTAREVALCALSRLQPGDAQNGCPMARRQLDCAVQALAIEELEAVQLQPLDCLAHAGDLEIIGDDNNDLQSMKDGIFNWLRRNLLLVLDVASPQSFFRPVTQIDCPADQVTARPLSQKMLSLLLDTLSAPPYATPRARKAPLDYCHLEPFGEFVRAICIANSRSKSSSSLSMLSHKMLLAHCYFQELVVYAEQLAGSVSSGAITLRCFAQVQARPDPLLCFSSALGASLTAATITDCHSSVLRFQGNLAATRQYLNRVQERSFVFPIAQSVVVHCMELLRALESTSDALQLSQLNTLGALSDEVAALVPIAHSLQDVKDSALYLSIWNCELDRAMTHYAADTANVGTEPPHMGMDVDINDADVDVNVEDGSLTTATVILDEGVEECKEEPVDDSAVRDFLALCEAVGERSDDQINQFLESFSGSKRSHLKMVSVRLLWSSDMVFEKELTALRKSDRFGDKLESWGNSCGAMMRSLSDSSQYCTILAPALLAMVQLFNCRTEASALIAMSHELVAVQTRPDEVLMSELTELMINWRRTVADQCGQHCSFEALTDFVCELQHCGAVIAFVDEVKDEKDFNLMDMVEENADSAIRAETVAEFESIRRALTPLLRPTVQSIRAKAIPEAASGNNVRAVAQAAPLQESAKVTLVSRLDTPEKMLREFSAKLLGSVTNTTAKLHSCRHQIHGIKAIWNSVAQREESTKYVCHQLNREGTVAWERTDATGFHLLLSCPLGGSRTEVKDKHAIEDLRSRALLLVNSAGKATESPSEIDRSEADKLAMRAFIDAAGVAMQVTELLSELTNLGHFRYQMQSFSSDFKLGSLTEVLRDAVEQRDQWQELLTTLRGKHKYINYFFSSQLWILHCCFAGIPCSGGTADDQLVYATVEQQEIAQAVSLLQFANDSRTLAEYAQYRGFYHDNSDLAGMLDSSEHSAMSHLSTLALALELVLGSNDDKEAETVAPLFVSGDPSSSVRGAISHIRYGSDSELLPVLLSLYPQSHSDYVRRHQLFVCDGTTTREEMNMFMHRVFAAPLQATPTRFAVLQLHKLNHTDCAYFLYVMKEGEQKFYDRHNGNTLVIVLREEQAWCIDGLQLPVLQGISTPSDEVIRKLFKARARNVMVVRSEVSGLGKSQSCINRSRAIGKTLRKLLVVDGMTRLQLVEAFSSLSLLLSQAQTGASTEALHLDICNLSRDNESDVGLGLFELLFIGTSQIGTIVVQWPVAAHCFIECGNKLETGRNLAIVDSLKYFVPVNITFSLEALSVNANPMSDMQVVCTYLHALDNNMLHLADIEYERDDDLEVAGAVEKEVLSDQTVRALLHKHFFQFFAGMPSSFAVLGVFLRVLGQQLRLFSDPKDLPHYKVWVLEEDGQDPRIRCDIVQSMIVCSRDFAAKSAVYVRQRQRDHLLCSAEANESEGMLKWEDSNQMMLCIVDSSLSVLYRKLADVDPNFRQWYDQQAGPDESLKDYFQQNSGELRVKLNIICRGRSDSFEGRPDYVLTADNFLKCVMMLLRVKTGVPVIVMGAAGCGKTSLVRFLASICCADFQVLNIHAGVTRTMIIDAVSGWIEEHSHQHPEKQLWIFMDEINTCGELGLIKSIMCDRILPGCDIPRNVAFFGACNPFKRRLEESVGPSVGLTLRGKAPAGRSDGLVYRVQPLVDSMLDYIWDFGSLSPADEKLYIAQYFSKLPDRDMLVKAVVASQNFMRKKCDPDAVSMRDVRRVRVLFLWFMDHKLPTTVTGFVYNLLGYGNNKAMSCIVLALAHCYRCRLRSTEMRQDYDEAISEAFSKRLTARAIRQCIVTEQEGYLKQMKLPHGIALNHALRENVYVLLVCILTKTPVFLVGEPGSSKSLSIVLLSSNMRGKDSESEFFRRLPEVKITAYQGSESSTSEGILKIFQKAEDYADAREKEKANVVTVVLIDEIGLAEISPFNPLKVIHSRLETADDSPLKVAVIGVSNWELDLSKMSRAVYLARPKPAADDLADTALRILETISLPETPRILRSIRPKLVSFSKCYLAFCADEEVSKTPNFHGLRDFYSMFKTLGLIIRNKHRDKMDVDDADWTYAMLRNFGGLLRPLAQTAFRQFFEYEATAYRRLTNRAKPATFSSLVADNLGDKEARHLMVISEGDSVLNEVGGIFAAAGVTSYRVMIGSPFKGDKTENYHYRMLSEIILCMERGESLALRDLDGIYGSLYDMLNQNYTVVAGKKNCRIALGAFSNPLARVHDDFKCIVLPEANDVHRLDPPFLNRFEKHYSHPELALSQDQLRIVGLLEKWIYSFCRCGQQLENGNDPFTERDVFVGCSGAGTLCSLVQLVYRKIESTMEGTVVEEDAVVSQCRHVLLQVASLQGMVRAPRDTSFPENVELFRRFLGDERHISLRHFLAAKIRCDRVNDMVPEAGGTLLTTYTKFFFLAASAHGEVDMHKHHVVYETMSGFDMELDLLACVQSFYRSASQRVLVLQFQWSEDANKLMIAKSVVKNAMRAYQNTAGGDDNLDKTTCSKHVVLLLHVNSELYKDDSRGGYELQFSQEWDHLHIDDLQQEEPVWASVCAALQNQHSTTAFLAENGHLVTSCVEQNLISAFRPLNYTNTKGLESTRSQRLCAAVAPGANCALKTLLKTLVRENLIHEAPATNQTGTSSSWIEQVAWDRESLDFAGSSLVLAATNYARRLVTAVLTKAMYVLEKHSATDAYCFVEDSCASQYHLTAFQNIPVLNLHQVRSQGQEGGSIGTEVLEVGAIIEGLRFPFSFLLEKRLEGVKLEYLNSRKGQEVALFDMRAGRTAAMVNMVNTITNEFVVEVWKCPTIDKGPCAAQYRSDVLRLFASEAGVVHLSTDVLEQTVYRLLELLGCPGTDVDSGWLHVFLWGHCDFISAMLNVLVGSDSYSMLTPAPQLKVLSDANRLVELCERGGLVATDADAIMKVTVYDLIEQFCCVQWQNLKDICTDDIENDADVALKTNALGAWSNGVAKKLPFLNTICRKAGFTFEFGQQPEDEIIDALNIELLQYYLCLQSFRWLCGLFKAPVTEVGGNSSAGIVALSHSFLHHLSLYVQGTPAKLTENSIDGLFLLLKQLTDDIETRLAVMVETEVEMVSVIRQQRVAVQELECRLLKRLLVLPSAEPNEAPPLFTSTAYHHLGRLVSSESESPPLSSRDLVSLLMEKLWFVFSTCDSDFQFLNNQIPGAVATIVADFDALFGAEACVKNSLLEVSMADRLHVELAAEFAGLPVDEQMCRTFTAVLGRWERSFDDLGLGERVYGLALCRWVLDEAALDLLVFAANPVGIEAPMSLNLVNVALDAATKRHAVFEVLRLYFIKALKRGTDASPTGGGELLFEDLQERCAEGGQLQRHVNWLGDYHWTADEVVTRMLPLLGASDAQMRGNAVEAWTDLTARAAPSGAKLSALLTGTPDQQRAAARCLISVSFGEKCRTTVPNSVLTDTSQLLEAWPAAVASRERIFFQAVHSRFTASATPPQCVIGHHELSTDDVFQLLIVTSLMGCHSESFRNCPLGTYIFTPEYMAGSFVLGADTNVSTMIRRSQKPGSEGTMNECPRCGRFYVLADCGMPGQDQKPCPTEGCSAILGGTNHNWAEPNTRVTRDAQAADHEDPKGYNAAAFPTEHLRTAGYTVRELNSTEFRMLNLLVHCSVLVSLCAATDVMSPTWCPVVGATPAAMANFVWDMIRGSWTGLCTEMHVEGDRKEILCAFVVQLINDMDTREIFPREPLTTMDLREAAEKRFCDYFREQLANFGPRSNEGLARLQETCDQASNVFKQQVMEYDPAPHSFLAMCFRITRRPTFEALHQALKAQPDSQEHYPALAAYFEHQEDLGRVQDILPLMRWPNELRTTMNFRFAPFAADSVAAVLIEHQHLNSQLFGDFADAWNRYHDSTAANGHEIEIDHSHSFVAWPCHKHVTKALSVDDSVLYSCMRTEGEGSEALMMAHALGCIQNRFLLQALHVHPELIPKQRLRLQEVTSSELIAHDPQRMHAEMMSLVQPSLQYGQGFELACDWDRLELLVKTRLVDGKRMLWTAVLEDRAVIPYRYTHEFFEDQAQVFARVNAVVRQQRPLPNPEGMRRDPGLRSTHLQAAALAETQLLPALDNIICMLLKQGTSSDLSGLTLGAFVDGSMDHSTVSLFTALRSKLSVIPQLRLSHIEALYESLEDLTAETVLGCIDSSFQVEMAPELLERTITLLVPIVGSLSVLECCFRRFVMRYLRRIGTGGSMNPTAPIYHYLGHFRWPEGVDMAELAEERPEVEQLFQELLIGHGGTLQRLLFDRAEELQAASSQGLRQTQTQVSAAPAVTPLDRFRRSSTTATASGTASGRNSSASSTTLLVGANRRRAVSTKPVALPEY